MTATTTAAGALLWTEASTALLGRVYDDTRAARRALLALGDFANALRVATSTEIKLATASPKDVALLRFTRDEAAWEVRYFGEVCIKSGLGAYTLLKLARASEEVLDEFLAAHRAEQEDFAALGGLDLN